MPSAGSGVDRIDPLRFLAGRRKRRLNHLSVLSLSLGFLSVSVVLLRATFALCYFVICVFCLLVVLVRLSTCQYHCK